MDMDSILATLSGIISVEQITTFLEGIADKVPQLEGIITTIIGFISGIGA